mgnify:CR=1 FL=1
MHPSDRESESKESFVLSGSASRREEPEEPYAYGRSAGEGTEWRKSLKPLVVAGAGLLVLIVLALLFLTGSPRGSEREALKGIDSRLRAVEEKLARLEAMESGLARLERRDKEAAALAERLAQLEAAWNKKFDQLARDAARPAARPQEPAAAVKPAEAAAKPAAAPAAVKPAAQPRVHVVQKGETLYGISRRYKVAFDELVKLNRLDPKAPLKAGQTLTLPPERG